MAYIGNDVRSNEDYKIIDDISSGFNGSATSFALQVGGATPVPFPKFEQQLLISVNGVIQEPDPTGSAGFKLTGTNIVFSSAPTNGHSFFGVIYAGADYVNAGGSFPDGSINFPSITFGADTDTGFTRTASGTVALISNGTKVAQFPTGQGSSGEALITDGAGNLSFGSPTSAFGNITLGDSIIHDGDTNTKIRFPEADAVTIETNGSERLRIGNVGQIGIAGANYGTSGQVLKSGGSGAAPAWEAGGNFTSYAIVAEIRSGTSDGGTLTANTWHTREINTEIADPDGIVSISSNQFTLQAGTYLIEWQAPAWRCDRHVTRLYDVTNSAARGNATIEFSQDSGSYTMSSSRGFARVTISGATVYKLETKGAVTKSDDGLGVDPGNLASCIYAMAKIFKEV